MCRTHTLLPANHASMTVCVISLSGGLVVSKCTARLDMECPYLDLHGMGHDGNAFTQYQLPAGLDIFVAARLSRDHETKQVRQSIVSITLPDGPPSSQDSTRDRRG